jgi:MoaA/NifB/PqqE/SkfB family radical SAM enzyme
MKISPYININRIEFVVTYQCSGKCKHCSFGDKLNHSDGFKHIKIHEVVESIKQVAEIFPVSSVMTFGGEPLLYPDAVCAIHETASSVGIRTKQLITNGYFTKNDELCRKVAISLKDAGINNLLLSVDAFHQETIPFQAVYQFAKHAMESGIPKMRLHPAWVVNQKHNNPYNEETKKIISKFNNLHIQVSNGNNIFLAGSAVKNLIEYYDKPHINLSELCGTVPYTTSLNNITSLSIVPNGDVMVCGFVIGNIYKQNITDIIYHYNPYEDEWMNAILHGGARELLELSKRKGIIVDASSCYSACDLCHKRNNFRLNGNFCE